MLVIDDRENEKVVNKLLMRLGDASQSPQGQAKVKRLISADYVIGQWGIEAKEINDLYRSIMGKGRVAHQLRALQENFEKPFLVVYGTKLKPYIRGRPSRQQIAIELNKMEKVIERFKITFYQRFPNVCYMELPTMSAFVDWLVTNHTQMTMDGQSQVNRLPDFVKQAHQTATLDDRVAALSSIRGITPKIATDLLSEFGSLPKILNSRQTQKNLMEVEGIGRKKAKKLLSLRDKFKSTE
tara:strand:- start:364 stop:1083 length:720 start_codon:yes stop_codon:yes gene_type:complete